MLNFQPVRDKTISLQDPARNPDRDNLRRDLNEMYDEIDRLIAGCAEADVVFVPVDATAGDPYAAEAEVPWREAVTEIERQAGEAV